MRLGKLRHTYSVCSICNVRSNIVEGFNSNGINGRKWFCTMMTSCDVFEILDYVIMISTVKFSLTFNMRDRNSEILNILNFRLSYKGIWENGVFSLTVRIGIPHHFPIKLTTSVQKKVITGVKYLSVNKIIVRRGQTIFKTAITGCIVFHYFWVSRISSTSKHYAYKKKLSANQIMIIMIKLSFSNHFWLWCSPGCTPYFHVGASFRSFLISRVT